jgi:hypothetical protein
MRAEESKLRKEKGCLEKRGTLVDASVVLVLLCSVVVMLQY